jgi:hypothetical protein
MVIYNNRGIHLSTILPAFSTTCAQPLKSASFIFAFQDGFGRISGAKLSGRDRQQAPRSAEFYLMHSENPARADDGPTGFDFRRHRSVHL